MAEGESEIVAGFHVEYSGMAFAVFFLAEYANMVLIAALTVLMFLGGWLPPVEVVPFTWIPGLFWFGLKTAAVAFLFLWFRATFSPLSIRPDHASWLESPDTGHSGMDCRDWSGKVLYAAQVCF